MTTFSTTGREGLVIIFCGISHCWYAVSVWMRLKHENTHWKMSWHSAIQTQQRYGSATHSPRYIKGLMNHFNDRITQSKLTRATYTQINVFECNHVGLIGFRIKCIHTNSLYRHECCTQFWKNASVAKFLLTGDLTSIKCYYGS